MFIGKQLQQQATSGQKNLQTSQPGSIKTTPQLFSMLSKFNLDPPQPATSSAFHGGGNCAASSENKCIRETHLPVPCSFVVLAIRIQLSCLTDFPTGFLPYEKNNFFFWTISPLPVPESQLSCVRSSTIVHVKKMTLIFGTVFQTCLSHKSEGSSENWKASCEECWTYVSETFCSFTYRCWSFHFTYRRWYFQICVCVCLFSRNEAHGFRRCTSYFLMCTIVAALVGL